MSAAANAAGYLHAHGLLPPSDQGLPEPKRIRSQARSEPPRPMRTPRIQYRKRRNYRMPSAAEYTDDTARFQP